MATTTEPVVLKKREELDRAGIRFCGDSGSGMQITGNQFTNTVALYGNDLATFPDYPAEIRAPAGTLPGVSGFTIQFSGGDEPGRAPDEHQGLEDQRNSHCKQRRFYGQRPAQSGPDRQSPRRSLT